MDRVLEVLSEYASSLHYQDLPAHLIHHVKRHVIDTLGCAMGCYYMEPPQIARAHALEVTGNPGATVLGTRHRSSPELAAFANGVMGRYLDFNETSVYGSHPSDNILPVLAIAEYAGADMQTTITAIVIAYEVQNRLAAACKKLKANGWDNAMYVVIASAAGAGKVLGLGKAQMAHALALAAVPNAPMGQTRVGELSMWKGCTAPNAARNGIFAALMAKRGLTGPEAAFEGPRGFNKQLGVAVQFPIFGGKGVPFTMEADKFKYYPCDYEVQCSINPASALHTILQGRLDEVEVIDIETYDNAIFVAADSPAKWNPPNRETADHSIPYAVAVALTRGTVWLDDFTPERIGDPTILALMQKIKIAATEECNKDWPEAYPFRITATMKSGQKYMEEVRYAKGHPKNPMSDQDIEAKFCKLMEPITSLSQARAALDQLWHLEDMQNAQALLMLFELNPSLKT